MQTGDLIVTSGYYLQSGIIGFGTRDIFNHVSVVIRLENDEIVEHGLQGKPYFLEMTPGMHYCYFTKTYKNNLSVVDEEEMLRMYKNIAFCHLKDRSIVNKEKIKKFLIDNCDAKFSGQKYGFMAHWLGLPLSYDRKPYFTCLQFVDYFYNYLGLYSNYKIENPRTFRELPVFAPPIVYRTVNQFIPVMPIFIFAILLILLLLILRKR
jgi:hypothetical protein